jgi:hypothetical protein
VKATYGTGSPPPYFEHARSSPQESPNMTVAVAAWAEAIGASARQSRATSRGRSTPANLCPRRNLRKQALGHLVHPERPQVPLAMAP